MGKKVKEPQMVIENGEPKAVILDIEDYRELLKRLEDSEDLKRLEEIRRQGVKYRPLQEYLMERDTGV